MRKGQVHPSTYLYKDLISNALITLLYEKKIDQIAITELCGQAQVSRRTFYRHFKDKNDVVDFYITKIMENLALELKEHSKQNKRSLVIAFFSFFEPYTKLLAILNSNGLGDLVFTSYIKCITVLTFPEASLQGSPYNMAFMLGGLWSLLTFWIMNGCKKVPSELADIVCSVV
jgi:AcrR family transcriptional regulator